MTTHLSQDEYTLRAAEWGTKDLYNEIVPYFSMVRQFHKVPTLLNCYLYLEQAINAEPILVRQNDRIVLDSFAQVYDVKVGHVQGIRIGYLFRTPLATRVSPTSFIAYRRSIDVKDLVDRQECATRRYRIGSLLFFTVSDQMLMISTVPESSFMDSLEN